MSVFKRLGNVAKGKVMEIGRALNDMAPDDEPDEIDPDRPPPLRREASGAAVSAPFDIEEKRSMLERLKAEGLLTDEEYASKLAALDAPAAPRARKKRTL